MLSFAKASDTKLVNIPKMSVVKFYRNQSFREKFYIGYNCTTEPRNIPSFIDSGQRFLTKVVLTDRVTDNKGVCSNNE